MTTTVDTPQGRRVTEEQFVDLGASLLPVQADPEWIPRTEYRWLQEHRDAHQDGVVHIRRGLRAVFTALVALEAGRVDDGEAERRYARAVSQALASGSDLPERSGASLPAEEFDALEEAWAAVRAACGEVATAAAAAAAEMQARRDEVWRTAVAHVRLRPVRGFTFSGQPAAHELLEEQRVRIGIFFDERTRLRGSPWTSR